MKVRKVWGSEDSYRSFQVDFSELDVSCKTPDTLSVVNL